MSWVSAVYGMISMLDIVLCEIFISINASRNWTFDQMVPTRLLSERSIFVTWPASQLTHFRLLQMFTASHRWVLSVRCSPSVEL